MLTKMTNLGFWLDLLSARRALNSVFLSIQHSPSNNQSNSNTTT